MTTTKKPAATTTTTKAKVYRVAREFGIPGGPEGELRTLPVGMQIPEGHVDADLIAEHKAAGDLEEV